MQIAVVIIAVVAVGWWLWQRPEASPAGVTDAPPEHGIVKRIVDPITIELESGHLVRYIGVRTPSVAGEVQCFGKEALLANESVVGETVRIEEEPLLTRSNDGVWTRYVWLVQGEVDEPPSPTPIVAGEESPPDSTDAADPPPNGPPDEGDEESPPNGPPGVEVDGLDAEKETEIEATPVPEERDPKDILINERIVEGGFGFPLVAEDMKYGKRMLAAARFASATGKGLWGQCEVESKESAQGNSFSTEAVTECVIKGKVGVTGEKLYRLPECPAYGDTLVIQSAGGAWFCAEDLAVDAGFTKAPDCS